MNPLVYLVIVFKTASGGQAIIYDEPFRDASSCNYAKVLLVEASRQSPENGEIAVAICAPMYKGKKS